MEPQIIARVSQIILEQRLGIKIPRNAGKQGSSPINDSVNISSQGNQATAVLKSLEQNNEEIRIRDLEDLKAKIQEKDYSLSAEMIENIAEKIAEIFV